MSVATKRETFRGADLLGVSSPSEIAYLERIDRGLPTGSIDRFMRATGLSEQAMDAIIPRRTRNRQRGRDRLSAEQSDRLARAADIYALAYEVFGERERANGWMKRPNAAFGDEPPTALLRTSTGATLVEEVLVRIAHGVYS
ncbi:MAG: type II RES/Xre toxin-antitoxin system antitoxin [Gemmatimonadota bacterium]